MESNAVTLSVVIPCFNYGKYVGEAIISVLRQTWRDFEIIVVDGGSTDDATIQKLRFLKECENDRFRVFMREGRHYVGDNRNFGISHARGRYICCLDADDKMDPTYMEKALFLMVREGWDVVSAAAHSFGAESRYYGVPERMSADDLLKENRIVTAAVFRKSLWEHVGGYKDFGIGSSYVWEDWHFWVKCALAGARMRNISDEALIHYRVHDQSSLSHQHGSIRELETQQRLIADDLAPDHWQDRPYHPETDTGPMDGAVAASPDAVGEDEGPVGGGVLCLLPALGQDLYRSCFRDRIEAIRAAGHRITIVVTDAAKKELAPLGDDAPWGVDVHALPLFLQPELFMPYVEYLLDKRGIVAAVAMGSEWALANKKEWQKRCPGVPLSFLHVEGVERMSASVASRLDPIWMPWARVGEGPVHTVGIKVRQSSHPDAKGQEIWLLDLEGPDGACLLYPDASLWMPEGWRLIESVGSPRGFAVLSDRVDASLRLHLIEGGGIRFLKHPFSGQCEISCATSGSALNLDLFSANPGQSVVRLEAGGRLVLEGRS